MVELKIKINLRKLLQEKNVTQLELSQLTGIRQATISEIVNRRRRSVNLNYLESIMKVLEITDISRLIQLEVNNDEEGLAS